MPVDRHPRIGGIVIAGIAALAFLTGYARAQELPAAAFGNKTELTSDAGHVALKWSGNDEPLIYELQSASDPDFTAPTVLYEGTDEASFLSGLPDGKYFFRLRARRADGDAWGPWSDTVQLECGHHSLALAWTLFASGGLLFLLIVLFVCVNARNLDRFGSSDA